MEIPSCDIDSALHGLVGQVTACSTAPYKALLQWGWPVAVAAAAVFKCFCCKTRFSNDKQRACMRDLQFPT